jgi:sigma-B regulation protein RsbU (phosphoserine phosphatase)
MSGRQAAMESDVARQMDQRLVELQSLFEMGKVLNSTLNLRTILNNLLLTPMGRMMITRGLVLVADNENKFTCEAVKGISREMLGKKVFMKDCIEMPVLVDELGENHQQCKQIFADIGIKLLLPLTSTQRTVGVLGLGPKLDNGIFADAEIEYLSSLANLAATSIENALMYQRLEAMNRELDKKIQELNTLFDIGKELNSTLDKEKIINLLMFALMGEMLINKCFLFLQDGDGLVLAATRGVPDDSMHYEPLKVQEFVDGLTRLTGPVLVEEDELPQALLALEQLDLKVIVPVRIQDQVKGVIILGEKITNRSFSRDELEFLSTLCNRAMISLENARLFQEALEMERIEEELNIARDIQQRLLPGSFPILENMEVLGINIPSRQVGGDFFDCIRLDEDRIALTIADVSGKGVPAALLMSNLQAGLHSLIDTDADIATIIAKLNNLIHAHTNYDKFITLFHTEVDLKNRKLTYVNAGHNPPLLYKSDGSHRALTTGGLLLGMMPNVVYQTETIDLENGDVLLAYTDGVSEAKNDDDEEFEEWRVKKVVENNLRSDARTIIDNLIEEIKVFTNDNLQKSDDVTLLVLRIL